MRKLTPEHLRDTARRAELDGLNELAELLNSVADKVAIFNEKSSRTLQEIYDNLGHERFWELWKELELMSTKDS